MRLASVDIEGKEYINVSRQRGVDGRADPQLEQDEPQGQPERQLGRQPQLELRVASAQGLLEITKRPEPGKSSGLFNLLLNRF